MSTAKMVADSTVTSDLPSEGRRRRKSSEGKQSKKLKKSTCKEASKNVTSEDSDSDLDLSKDLFSIGGYIKDRPEMVEQMFQAVRGPSLRRTLPDILLDLPVDDLKQRCLEQLEIMSRKRILRILQGDIPADISSSGTEDSSGEDVGVDEDGEPNSTASSDQDQAEDENKDDVEEAIGSEDGSDEEEEFEEASEEGIDEEPEEEEMDQVESGDEVEGSVEEEAVNEVEMVEEEAEVESSASENCEEEPVNESQCFACSSEAEQSVQLSIETSEGKSQRTPTLTKEQMEILELEMRARAIKAMLNKHPKTLIPMSPIDNTKKVQEMGETVKHDVRQSVGEGITCKSSKAQKERHSKKKTEIDSLHVHNASVHLEGKTMQRSKWKSTDSCHSISKSSVSQERSTPTCSNELNADSNSVDHTDNSAAEFDPEDGEVASEGETTDSQDNSNQVVLSENEESEHSVDSSTTTL